MQSWLTITTILLALSALSASRAMDRIEITRWEFSVKDRFQNKWFPATTPSHLHVDLLENKLIEDPFDGTSEGSFAWIHDAYATYRTNFSVPEGWNHKNIELVFEGLDTYCDIKLNGASILTTNNSFVKYIAEIKSNQLLGNNTLEISFTPSKIMDTKQESRIHLPFGHGHTRKPPYHYGWDWAPTLIPVGIWRPVYLVGFDDARFDYVWIRDKFISESTATINCAVVLRSIAPETLSQAGLEVSILLNGDLMSTLPATQPILYRDIVIPSPKLWWPHNVGTPYVYNVTFILRDTKSSTNQILKTIHGIRTIELNTTGGAFQFIINGYPIYAKGGNYVPADMFHSRFANSAHHKNNTPTPQQYVDTMVESNYNMIRVWGGGQYETDEFYEILSRKGIMAFHDFMFSVNTYPAHEEFFRGVEIELKQQVRRIRNYPCLALWSGNNEVYQGIREWGWGSDQYRKNYDLLFEKLIRKVVQIESPDIFYIPSSPQYGSGGDTSQGDIHYWMVWAGSAPFENYDTMIGRFNSEFGTQAFPVWQTTKTFSKDPNSLGYNSPEARYHEKHGSQFNTLSHYIEQNMHKSLNFEMEVYQSSLVQAYAISIAIVAQRIEKTKCWGTLYWQFNDAWPSVSWASMDYYGRWKALQYVAKNLYTDVAVLFRRVNTNDGATVWAVNDKLGKSPAMIRVKVLSLTGEVLFNENKTIIIQPNTAVNLFNFTSTELNKLTANKNIRTTQLCFFGELIAGKERSMRSTYYIKHNKEMEWPTNGTLTIKYLKDSIKLTSDAVLRSVYISHKDKYIQLSDNFFDVIPGEEFEVTLKGGLKLEDVRSGLVFRSYVQTYTAGSLSVKIE